MTGISGPEGDYSEFAMSLIPVANAALSRTRDFMFPVVADDVRLEGPDTSPTLVMQFHLKDAPTIRYGVRIEVASFSSGSASADEESLGLHDDIMEIVDTRGFSGDHEAVHWFDL